MRREDRLVNDIKSIFDILSRCTVIRLGLFDINYPYLIPMTFGLEEKDGKITIYIHSALEGKKNSLIEANSNVCVEADLYYRTEDTPKGVTAKYESVIGFGKAIKLTNKEDKVRGLKMILDHYSHSGFPVESCKGLSMCTVYSITLDSVSGKHNL